MASRRRRGRAGSFCWGRDGPRAPILRTWVPWRLPGALQAWARGHAGAQRIFAEPSCLCYSQPATCSLRQPRLWQYSFSFVFARPSKTGEVLQPLDPAHSTCENCLLWQLYNATRDRWT